MSNETDIWKLIAGPIRALNEAEAANAANFVDLISELAFEDEPENIKFAIAPQVPLTRKLREFSFETEVMDDLGNSRRNIVKVPMLQMIPVGGVSIERAKLNYSLNAKALLEDDTKSSTAARQSSAIAGSQLLPRKTRAILPRFTGQLGQKNGSAEGVKTDGNIDIEVELRQIDLPTGLLDAFNITRSTIQDVTPDIIENTDSADAKHKHLFDLQVLDQTPGTLQAEKPFSIKLRVLINQKLSEGQPVVITLAPQTSGALKLMRPAEKIEVTENTEIDLVLLPTKRLAKSSIKTRIGVLFQAQNAKGSIHHEYFLDLPR